jgi:hypothetical protein
LPLRHYAIIAIDIAITPPLLFIAAAIDAIISLIFIIDYFDAAAAMPAIIDYFRHCHAIDDYAILITPLRR